MVCGTTSVILAMRGGGLEVAVVFPGDMQTVNGRAAKEWLLGRSTGVVALSSKLEGGGGTPFPLPHSECRHRCCLLLIPQSPRQGYTQRGEGVSIFETPLVRPFLARLELL